jgi:hypothetical protein
MEVHPGVVEAQNGGLKSHNRAMEVHPGAVDAQNGGLSLTEEPWRFTLHGAMKAQYGGLKSHNRAMAGL